MESGFWLQLKEAHLHQVSQSSLAWAKHLSAFVAADTADTAVGFDIHSLVAASF